MMKYLVMENHESHSIVMDEAGMFHRVANMGYEVGDTITEPIFMKTPKRKKKVDVKKLSTIAAIFVCFLLASVPFISNNNESDVVVYMSINPEVHLEMNQDGKINKLVADNEDGKVLLEGYKYRGKSVSSVLNDLIDRAERLEFLSEGGDIHITVEASDDYKAKEVTIDLSELLNNTYVKKYLIKIRANQEDFCDVEDVRKHMGTEGTSETEMTEASDVETYINPSNYSVEITAPYDNADSATSPTPDDPSDVNKGTDSSKATEGTKPTESQPATSAPTEEITTETTVPTEETTTEETTTEPSSTESDDSGDDDDWEWPWWPWPFSKL